MMQFVYLVKSAADFFLMPLFDVVVFSGITKNQIVDQQKIDVALPGAAHKAV